MAIYHRGHNTSNAHLHGSFKDCCIARTWRGREDIGEGKRAIPKTHFNSFQQSSLVKFNSKSLAFPGCGFPTPRSTNTTSRYSVLPPGSQMHEGSMLTSRVSEELGITVKLQLLVIPQPPHPPTPPCHVRLAFPCSRKLVVRLQMAPGISISGSLSELEDQLTTPSIFCFFCSNAPGPRTPPFIFCFCSPAPLAIFCFFCPPCTLLATGRLPSILIERSAIPGSRLSLGRPSVSKACLQDMIVSINQGLPSEPERELTCPPAPSCTRCPGRPNVLLRAREEDRSLPAAEMCC